MGGGNIGIGLDQFGVRFIPKAATSRIKRERSNIERHALDKRGVDCGTLLIHRAVECSAIRRDFN